MRALFAADRAWSPAWPPAPAGAASYAGKVTAVVAGALALALTLANAPWLAVGIIVGGGVVTLVLMRPLIVVGALLFIGPLDLSFLTGGYKSLFESTGGLDMNGIRLVAVVTGFGLLILLDRRLQRIAVGRYGRWYLAFLAFAAASITYSSSPLDGVRLLLKLAYPFLIFVVVLGTVKERRELDRLATWTLAGAALLTIVVSPLYLLGSGIFYDEMLGVRVSGAGVHTSTWSFYLLLIALLALVRYSVWRDMRYVGLAVVCAIWIVLSLTRSTLLAAGGSLALLAVYSAVVDRDFRLLSLTIVIGLAMTAALWPAFARKTFGNNPPSFLTFLSLLRRPAELIPMLSLSGREVFWPVIFFYFLSSPRIGLGLGSTTEIMQTNFPVEAGGVVHNEYLRLAAETGVIGLALFALALGFWWAGAIRAALLRLPGLKEWALPALAALIVWAVTAISDNSLDYYSAVSQYVGFLTAAAIWVTKAADSGDAAQESL